VIAILLAILWIPQYNTLQDYPIHLARAWALDHYDRTPFFQTVFARALDPIPNLAIDLIVPPLLWVLPPLIAGKVFLSLIVLLFAAGCHGLASAIYGRPSWTVPIATFAVFNSPLIAGFVNSAFSLSLFLVSLAVWLKMRRKWSLTGWLTTTVLATMTYLAHLSGFVFLGFAMGICTIFEISRQKPLRVRSAHFVSFSVLIPAVIIQLYPWANRLHTDAPIHWGTWKGKILALASTFVGFRYDIDVAAMVLFAVALAVLAVKGKVRFDSLLLWLGMAFLAAVFICPTELGGNSGADHRFPPPAIVFLLLSSMATAPRKMARVVFSLALGAMLLRTGEIGWHLNGASSKAEIMVAALRKAAPDSRIYDMFIRPQDVEADKRLRGNLHVSSYSVILTGSVPSSFIALRGQQPLYFRNAAECQWEFIPRLLDWNLATHDYVWACNLDASRRAYLSERASLVSSADICGLWKLRK